MRPNLPDTPAMKNSKLAVLIVGATALLVLIALGGCRASSPPAEPVATQPVTPVPTATGPVGPESPATQLVTPEAATTGPVTPAPSPADMGQAESPPEDATPADAMPTPEATDLLEGVIMTRAPDPTATPGRIEQQVEELAETAGLAEASFLGLSLVNWTNLAISLLYVLIGYLIGTALIRYVLPLIVRGTKTQFDDHLLGAIVGDIRRLVVILALYMATDRLTFASIEVKQFLGDVYFVLGLFLGVLIVFKLIDLAGSWFRQRMAQAGREGEPDRVNMLLSRAARVLTVVVGAIILLAHFGVNVTALSATLGLGGLAFTLAAQDTVSDAIAGVIILIDRPFRVGDRIEIQAAGTWGDVMDIGFGPPGSGRLTTGWSSCPTRPSAATRSRTTAIPSHPTAARPI